MSNVGQLIKLQREMLGLTQDAVAKKLGFVNAQFVSNIERGLASLPNRHARPLARLLKITVDDIIDAKAADLKEQMRREAKDGNSQKRVS